MEAGTVLAGRFRIERLLGRGGMASVYEATQLDLKRRVALKLLSDERDAIPSIEREARAAAQLAHPHIVQVTEVVKPDGAPPFLVMELLEGESLDARIARTGPLSADRAAFITVQVLSALGSAHASGIIHRDVKPANVFLTRTAATNDFVKLLDFGVARRASGAVSSKGGRHGGTPAYMAPEQIVADSPIDERSDIWAVGVCLYEMIAGAAPFAASNIPSLLVKICEGNAPALPTDHELSAIVTKAMAKDPADRFASAEEMRVALLPIARADIVPSALAVPAPLGSGANDAPTLTAPTPRINEPARSESTRGATLPSAPPPPAQRASSPYRGFALGLIGAGGVLAIAIGLSNRPRTEATPIPKASAVVVAPKAPLTECVLGTPLAPWPIARRRLSLAATNDEVLLATDAPDDEQVPLYASAPADGSKLEDWKVPPFIVEGPSVHWHSDATALESELVGVAIRIESAPGKTPETKYMLFSNRRLPNGTPTFGRAFIEGEDTRLATVSVVGVSTYLVASGTGKVPTAVTAFPHTRVVRRDRSFGDVAFFPDVDPPTDLALAVTPDRVSVVVTFADKVQVATYVAANLQPLPPRSMEGGRPEHARVAILHGDSLVVWHDRDAHELHHMVTRGADLMHRGMIARGEISAHAVAATANTALLAFAKKAAGVTTIFAGSGPTLYEAALSVQAVRVVSNVTQLKMTGGARPWLAWTEATGEDAANAYVARLDCP